MSWHIEVVYAPGLRPTVWSYGYPTKRSADQARSRLVKEAKTEGSHRTYKVKETTR